MCLFAPVIALMMTLNCRNMLAPFYRITFWFKSISISLSAWVSFSFFNRLPSSLMVLTSSSFHYVVLVKVLYQLAKLVYRISANLAATFFPKSSEMWPENDPNAGVPIFRAIFCSAFTCRHQHLSKVVHKAQTAINRLK